MIYELKHKHDRKIQRFEHELSKRDLETSNLHANVSDLKKIVAALERQNGKMVGIMRDYGSKPDYYENAHVPPPRQGPFHQNGGGGQSTGSGAGASPKGRGGMRPAAGASAGTRGGGDAHMQARQDREARCGAPPGPRRGRRTGSRRRREADDGIHAGARPPHRDAARDRRVRLP